MDLIQTASLNGLILKLQGTTGDYSKTAGSDGGNHFWYS